jgi:putative glutamine amidotransferase
MTWLVTSTLKDKADSRYARWLAGAGIALEWVRPGEPAPRSWTMFDALLLTGGGDVDPVLYGAAPDPHTVFVNRERDESEIALVRCFLDHHKPVFGICRGIQVLNVAQGGRLIQHLPNYPATGGAEGHAQVAGRDVRHRVSLEAGSRLVSVLGPEGEVNSAHHQALDPAAVGAGLRVAARSPAGIIEAVEGEADPVLAVQWHPERMPPGHPASGRLLQLFTEMVSGEGDRS